jgi:uncharacterized repeat protein (TIGR03803 family)
LIVDAAGNFYGTTAHGGTGDCQTGPGCGTVFKLDAAGEEKVLHSSSGPPDEASPFSGLVIDALGNLYGTTVDGGTDPCNGVGCGTVFKLDTAGNETLLYIFNGGMNVAYPYAGLVKDPAGNLYGGTEDGGDLTTTAPTGSGIVFKHTLPSSISGADTTRASTPRR